MKKIYLLIALACSHAAVFSQTVFTYGPHAVSKDEFLRAYNKNNSPVTDKESSLREYLDLYSNFKLKVKAAEELRLDTLPQIQYDITNFRQQVEENYMSDEKGTNKLLDEAFIRSQKDLHVLHFSIPVPANKTDSLNTYRYEFTFVICCSAAFGKPFNRCIPQYIFFTFHHPQNIRLQMLVLMYRYVLLEFFNRKEC